MSADDGEIYAKQLFRSLNVSKINGKSIVRLLRDVGVELVTYAISQDQITQIELNFKPFPTDETFDAWKKTLVEPILDNFRKLMVGRRVHVKYDPKKCSTFGLGC